MIFMFVFRGAVKGLVSMQLLSQSKRFRRLYRIFHVSRTIQLGIVSTSGEPMGPTRCSGRWPGRDVEALLGVNRGTKLATQGVG